MRRASGQASPRVGPKRTTDGSGQRVGSVSRRRRGAGGAGLEVCQDGGDHPRVGDHGEHAKGRAAARTTAEVDVEHAAQTLRPGHCAASGRRRRRGVIVHGCRHRRGHDEAAMARVRCEQPVKAHEMDSRTWHQSGQARDEVERLDEIAGSDFEPPKAGPKGEGQDARSNRTCVVPSRKGCFSS